MTKYLHHLLQLVTAFLFAACGYAQKIEVDGIYYYLSKTDRTANVVSYLSDEYDVIIPDSLTSNGVTYTVTNIGDWAFPGYIGLTSIEIPSSVTTIGDFAFYMCSSLKSITMHEGLERIGNYAFDGCSGLTSIDIPSSVTHIGEGAFHHCSGLTSIHMPSGLTHIGKNAFSDCCGLTSIHIPSGVTHIGNSAFKFCSGLTQIYSFSLVPPTGKRYIFNTAHFNNVTLYVLPEALKAYKSAEPWLRFKDIQTFDPTTINGHQNFWKRLGEHVLRPARTPAGHTAPGRGYRTPTRRTTRKVSAK